MRIDKLLANQGYGSRKEVKQLLKSGQVKLNNQIIKEAKYKVNPEEDSVVIDGEVVKYKEYVYYVMNKPSGVISATEDDKHKTVIDLLDKEDAVYQPFPVGRLDKDTEGLLIITNDGQLSHQLLSPKKHVPKTYYARINGQVTESHIELFRKGIVLEDGYKAKPANLKIEKSGDVSSIFVTVTEGKFHQVKRMFEAINTKVIYLKRVQMGPLSLDSSLRLGEYRELSEEEVKRLQNADQTN
ncbi:pseudouridine synthase [Bacillus carboniphilus]|uniref:Pseudouridine synthase n=1 Tax=Bacillus carboniphilus TaxID=86663 RepID=A0ABY9JP52_9BACI|nr:pseudouridine synthase [Bacillus carboniphilus]WLR41156.1 pseudouridine synthase [Bacillus carboniphilus]